MGQRPQDSRGSAWKSWTQGHRDDAACASSWAGDRRQGHGQQAVLPGDHATWTSSEYQLFSGPHMPNTEWLAAANAEGLNDDGSSGRKRARQMAGAGAGVGPRAGAGFGHRAGAGDRAGAGGTGVNAPAGVQGDMVSKAHFEQNDTAWKRRVEAVREQYKFELKAHQEASSKKAKETREYWLKREQAHQQSNARLKEQLKQKNGQNAMLEAAKQGAVAEVEQQALRLQELQEQMRATEAARQAAVAEAQQQAVVLQQALEEVQAAQAAKQAAVAEAQQRAIQLNGTREEVRAAEAAMQATEAEARQKARQLQQVLTVVDAATSRMAVARGAIMALPRGGGSILGDLLRDFEQMQLIIQDARANAAVGSTAATQQAGSG